MLPWCSFLPPSLGRGCSLARLRSPLYRWAISLTVLSVRLSLSSSFSLTLRFGRRRGSKKAAHSEMTARRSMLAARTSRSRLRLRALAAFFGPSASALFYPSGPPSFDTYSTISGLYCLLRLPSANAMRRPKGGAAARGRGQADAPRPSAATTATTDNS